MNGKRGATGSSTVYERISYEQRKKLKEFIAEHRKFCKSGTVFKVMPPRKSDKPKTDDPNKPTKGAWRKREVKRPKHRQTMRTCLLKHQEFAEFVAMLMFDENYEINAESNRELIIRQLQKLGYVSYKNGEYIYYDYSDKSECE